MEYGIVVFKETINIGDDIQSYAAMKQLPKVDYFIEREELNEFQPKNKNTVKTLISGWFLHHRYRFPPSPYINPFFISCHFSSLNDMMGITTEYVDDYVKEYMKRYEPIGCRDEVTEKLFKNNDIKTYRSGCLTLTIPKFKGVKKQQKIVLVDTAPELKKAVEKQYEGSIIEKTHFVDKEKNSKLSYEKRMKNVEALLKEYQSAELVITTRLHCALPCLALETPVLLIYDKDNYDIVSRIGDYCKLVDYCSEQEFLEKGLSEYFIKTPRKDHLKIKNELMKRVEEFLKDTKEEKVDIKEEMVKTLHHVNQLVEIHDQALIEELPKLKIDFTNMKYAKEYWEQEFYTLLEKYEKLQGKRKKSPKDILSKGISIIKKKEK